MLILKSPYHFFPTGFRSLCVLVNRFSLYFSTYEKSLKLHSLGPRLMAVSREGISIYFWGVRLKSSPGGLDLGWASSHNFPHFSFSSWESLLINHFYAYLYFTLCFQQIHLYSWCPFKITKLRVGEMAQWIKCTTLHIHENPKPDPSVHVKARHGGSCVQPQHWGTGQIQRLHLPVSTNKLMGSWVRERPRHRNWR